MRHEEPERAKTKPRCAEEARMRQCKTGEARGCHKERALPGFSRFTSSSKTPLPQQSGDS